MLADAAFFPFRQSQTVTALSGAALGVRAGGLAAQGAFREEARPRERTLPYPAHATLGRGRALWSAAGAREP